VSRAGWLLAAVLFAVALPGRPPEPAPCIARTGAAGLLCGVPLDLNRASPLDLEVLPGIGPRRAGALAAARPYTSVADITRVHGIGEARLESLSSWVEVRP
jgi:hypothetical protein